MQRWQVIGFSFDESKHNIFWPEAYVKNGFHFPCYCADMHVCALMYALCCNISPSFYKTRILCLPEIALAMKFYASVEMLGNEIGEPSDSLLI